MKRDSFQRTALLALLDILCAWAAMAGAFVIRFHILNGYQPVGGFAYHMLWGGAYAPVYVLLYGLLGVYSARAERSYVHEYGRVLLGNTIALMLLVDLIYLFREAYLSRWMLFIYYLLMDALTMLRGFLYHRWLRARYKKGRELRRLVILGDGTAARDCLRRIRARQEVGVQVIGSIGDLPLGTLPLLGGYDRLDALLAETSPDMAVIALDETQADALTDILRLCQATGVPLAMLPMSYRTLSARPYREDLAGLPLINIRRVRLDEPAAALLKRLGDILGSAALLVLTSPIMLLAALGTRLSSPGPVLFRQERIGKDRRPFQMLKFRSMRLNDASQTAWTRRGDARRTRFGAFMRRYSIDELPQLWNVLRGDMSLVGPRPEIPLYVDHFKYSVPLYMVRHQVRPGITGWAQVHGLRGNTSIEERVDYDLYYIENWTPLLDIKILLMTPFRGIVNRQESLL